MNSAKNVTFQDIQGFKPLTTLNMDENFIAQFIVTERGKQDITQEELSDLSGVSVRAIKNMEKGVRVKKSTRNKVLLALGYQVIETLEKINK